MRLIPRATSLIKWSDVPLLLRSQPMDSRQACEELARFIGEAAGSHCTCLVLLSPDGTVIRHVCNSGDFRCGTNAKVRHLVSSLRERIRPGIITNLDTHYPCSAGLLIKSRMHQTLILTCTPRRRWPRNSEELRQQFNLIAAILDQSLNETRARTLWRLAKDIAGNLDIGSILASAEAAVKELFGWSGVAFLAVVGDGSDACMRVLHDTESAHKGRTIPRKKGGLAWWTIENRDFLIYKGEKDPEGRSFVTTGFHGRVRVRPFVIEPLQEETSILMTPLFHDGRAVGVLKTYTTEPQAMPDGSWDSALLGGVGSLLSTVIVNAESYEQLLAERRRAEGILRISDAIASATSLDETMQVCLESVVSIVGGDMGFIALRDLDTNLVTANYSFNRDLDTIPVFDLDGEFGEPGIAGRVLRTGKSILCNNLHTDPRFIHKFDTIQSKINVPILLPEEETLGVVSVDSCHVDAFSERDQMLLEAVARQLATFVSERRFLVGLAELSRPFLDVERPETLRKKLLQRLTAILGVEVAFFHEIEEGSLMTLAVEGADALNESQQIRIPEGKGLSWKAVESQRPLQVY